MSFVNFMSWHQFSYYFKKYIAFLEIALLVTDLQRQLYDSKGKKGILFVDKALFVLFFTCGSLCTYF